MKLYQETETEAFTFQWARQIWCWILFSPRWAMVWVPKTTVKMKPLINWSPDIHVGLPLRIKVCRWLSFHFSFLLKNLKEGPLTRSRSITLLEVPAFRPTLPGTLSPVGPALWVLAKLPDADMPCSVVSRISVHRRREGAETLPQLQSHTIFQALISQFSIPAIMNACLGNDFPRRHLTCWEDGREARFTDILFCKKTHTLQVKHISVCLASLESMAHGSECSFSFTHRRPELLSFGFGAFSSVTTKSQQRGFSCSLPEAESSVHV